MNAAWLHPLLMVIAALTGLAAGSLFGADESVSWLIEPLLIVMLFSVFLCIDVGDVGRSLSNRRFLSVALLINFVWAPVLAYLLGIGFFGDSVDARIGLIMLLVTPCTDWYLVFTSVAKGNVPLSGSLLPFNLVLQILLLPVYIEFFIGSDASFDMLRMFIDMGIILIPLAAAAVVRLIASRCGPLLRITESLNFKADPIQLFFLCLAIAVMFAAESTVLSDNLGLLVETLVPLLVFFVVNYLLAHVVSRIMGFPYDDCTSLTFTTMARNSPLALAIAVMVFPDQPIVMLMLVIGPLIELPILSVAASLRLRGRNPTNLPE